MNSSMTIGRTPANPPADARPSRFVPTEDELFQLAKHWVKEAIIDDWFIFWGQSFSQSDVWKIDVDWGRVAEIEAFLGEERTKVAVREAYEESAHEFVDRSSWIVFRYGTSAEKSLYQKRGRPGFFDFEEGQAEELASKVVERVFSSDTNEEQESLLKEELSRHAGKLWAKAGRKMWCVVVFGISFPTELKPLVLNTGAEDPQPHSEYSTVFTNLTIEQGKKFLVALEAAAEKTEKKSVSAVPMTTQQRAKRKRSAGQTSQDRMHVAETENS